MHVVCKEKTINLGFGLDNPAILGLHAGVRPGLYEVKRTANNGALDHMHPYVCLYLKFTPV